MISHLFLHHERGSVFILTFTSSIGMCSFARVIVAIVSFPLVITCSSRHYTTARGLVYYPAHTLEQIAMYREYAQIHRLLTSSGSDSHGPEVDFIQSVDKKRKAE